MLNILFIFKHALCNTETKFLMFPIIKRSKLQKVILGSRHFLDDSNVSMETLS